MGTPLQLLFKDHSCQFFGTIVNDAVCDDCRRSFSFATVIDRSATVQVSVLESSEKAAAKAEQMAEAAVNEVAETVVCTDPCPHCGRIAKTTPHAREPKWISPWLESLHSTLCSLAVLVSIMSVLMGMIYVLVLFTQPRAPGRPGLEQFLTKLVVGDALTIGVAIALWWCFTRESDGLSSETSQAMHATDPAPLAKIPVERCEQMINRARTRRFAKLIDETIQERRELITLALLGGPLFVAIILGPEILGSDSPLLLSLPVLLIGFVFAMIQYRAMTQLAAPGSDFRTNYRNAIRLPPEELPGAEP